MGKGVRAVFRQRLFAAMASAILMAVAIPDAFALSNGCATLNGLSGATALSFSTNRYPAADFLPGDALTLTFQDNGAGQGSSPTTADSVGLSRYNLSGFSTYNAANSNSNTPHTVTLTVPTPSLETNGIAIRASTTQGQISNLVFTCTSSAQASTDASLSALSLSAGSLAPGFSSSSTRYSASVSNATAALTARPTAADAGGTITVNGAAVASGTDSAAIPLAVGDNTLNIVVVAADRQTSQTYTVTVTRAQPAPVAGNATASVAANSANNPITLLITGSATSVAVSTPASHGAATASGTGIVYTPAAGYSGSDSFGYTASNGSGTSSPATVTVSVTPATLALSPGAGPLPAATLGSPYHGTFSASGGTGPYAFSAAALPAGLTLDPTSGNLSGTPTLAGSSSFSVTASDAHSAQVTAHYTLDINAATAIAANASLALMGGQSASLDLSAGASGGPFIAASLLDTLASSVGTAHLNGTVLSITAAPKASGTATLRFTLTNAAGTSAPATLTLQINTRPDPSRDPEVIGVLSAQAQSAQQFARAQVSNFTDRLEQLHSAEGHRSAFNLRFAPMQAQTVKGQGEAGPGLYEPGVFGTTQLLATDPGPALQATAERPTEQPPAGGEVSVWSGGYVDFGSTQRGGSKVSNSTLGVSSGIDFSLSPALTLGAGIGFGNDHSDIGSSGSYSRGKAYSLAAYGSFHPGAVFLDALFGYSRLQFDTRRYVPDANADAKGTRDGDQLFGALSAGYEIKGMRWLISPYGRLSTSTTWLHAYKEANADGYNLAYAQQRVALVSGTAGVRGQYGIPLGWAYLTLRSRLELSHTLNADSTARLGYVDIDDSSYSVTTRGFGDDTLAAALGADLSWASGISTGIGYQGTRALGEQSRSDALSLRAAYRF